MQVEVVEAQTDVKIEERREAAPMVTEMETSAADWNNNSIIYIYFAWGLHNSRYSWSPCVAILD